MYMHRTNEFSSHTTPVKIVLSQFPDEGGISPSTQRRYKDGKVEISNHLANMFRSLNVDMLDDDPLTLKVPLGGDGNFSSTETNSRNNHFLYSPDREDTLRQTNEHKLYHENEFGNCKGLKFPRSSSLKVRKADAADDNNGACSTPQVGKEVRFADAFGLDLATVKTIFNQDNPPTIPDSAKRYLSIDSNGDDVGGDIGMFGETDDELGRAKENLNGIGTVDGGLTVKEFLLQNVVGGAAARRNGLNRKRVYMNCFPQPGKNVNFAHRVRESNLCLESAKIDELGRLTGTVQVTNLAYNKFVWARISLNAWQSYVDVSARYVCTLHETNTDRFEFAYYVPPDLSGEATVQFALRYLCRHEGGGEKSESEQEFWDNNFGKNYVFMSTSVAPQEQ